MAAETRRADQGQRTLEPSDMSRLVIGQERDMATATRAALTM